MFDGIRKRIGGVLSPEWAARFQAAEDDPKRRSAVFEAWRDGRPAASVRMAPEAPPAPEKSSWLAEARRKSDELERRLAESTRKAGGSS